MLRFVIKFSMQEILFYLFVHMRFAFRYGKHSGLIYYYAIYLMRAPTTLENSFI